MTERVTADQLNAALLEIAHTAGFEVQFSGTGFNAWNNVTGKKVRGQFSADPEANGRTLAATIADLRWPPNPPAAAKNRPFKGPPPTDQEKFRAQLELLEKQGQSDARTKLAQQLQLEHPRPDLPKGITYEPTWVGPEEARRYLLDIGGVRIDGRPVQRPLSMIAVKKYADLMLGGGWGLSPDPFAFDKRGLGINGQHRWGALVYTGLTLPFMVSHGWESGEAFAYLDKQLRRMTYTTLALDGYANAKDLATCAALLAKAEKEPKVPAWTTKIRADEAEVRNMVAARPLLTEAVRWASSGTPQFFHRFALAAARTLAAEQCGEIDQNGKPLGDWDATSEFFEALKKGGGINEGHPAYAIRNFLSTGGRNSSPRVSDKRTLDKGGFQLHLFLMAWNLWVRREKLYRPSYKVSAIEIPKPLRPRA